MKKNDDLLEDQTDEDDILDLSLDDLSPSDINQASDDGETDEEIIELMELVGKGKKDLKDSDGEITLTYRGDDQPTKDLKTAARAVKVPPDDRQASGEEVSLSETDMALANISLESDISLLEGGEADAGDKGEDLVEDEIEKMLKEENGQDLNRTVLSPLDSSQAFKPAEQIELEETEALEIKLPSKIGGKKTLKQHDTTHPPAKEIPAISEEKIEAIVTRVVEDVVERVARETMANVAERVIREAIDALKQSLEKDSE